ncbi:Zinc finger AN1 and C2H2 domain-containing stress-associated protein 13, partial [Durusdinium trenchii]
APPAGVADAPRLAGDCYREPEWVCRSAEDDSLDVGSELLLGDPYHDMQLLGGAFEAAPVQRGAAQAARCAAAPETVGLPVLELLREDRTEIAQIDAAFFAHG